MLRIELIEVIRFQWVNHVSMRFVHFQLPLNVIMNASIHRYRFNVCSFSPPSPTICLSLSVYLPLHVYIDTFARSYQYMQPNKCAHDSPLPPQTTLKRRTEIRSPGNGPLFLCNNDKYTYILASSVDLQPISNSLNDYCFSIMLDYDKSHLWPFQKSKSMLFLLLLLLPLCFILFHSWNTYKCHAMPCHVVSSLSRTNTTHTQN